MKIAQRTARPGFSASAFAQSLRCGTVLAALVVTAAAPPALAAEPANVPIEIRSCSPVYAPVPEQVYAMGINTVAGVEIDYVNRAAVPAEDVTFLVGDGAAGIILADHGTFAPGTLIQHVFWTGSNVDTSTCSVAAARLRGGIAYDAQSSSKRANR